MTKGLALARLLWRPATLLALIPIGFAVVSPGLILADRFDRGLRLGSPEAITAILWVEAITLMGAVGAFLGGAARDVDQPLFAFAVPSLRSIVFRQKLAFGLMLALVLAVAVFLMGDAVGSIATFGCALFFFAVGSSLADPLAGGWWKAIGIPVIILAWFQAERVIRVIASAPALSAAVCVVLAAAILYHEQSIEAGRRRAILPAAPLGFGFGGVFGKALTGDDDLGSANPTGARNGNQTIEFFKAADHEVFGARRYGSLKALLGAVLFMCGFAYVSSNPAMVGMMGLMSVSLRPHRLMGRWPYPISRANRAKLAFVSSLVDCASYFALAMIIMVLLESSALPRIRLFGDMPNPSKDLPLIPIGFIWSPIAMWIGVAGVAPTRKEMKSTVWNGKRVVCFVTAILLSGFTFVGLMRLESHFSLTVAIAAGAALAICVQVIFWLALRWHFARKDLI